MEKVFFGIKSKQHSALCRRFIWYSSRWAGFEKAKRKNCAHMCWKAHIVPLEIRNETHNAEVTKPNKVERNETVGKRFSPFSCWLLILASCKKALEVLNHKEWEEGKSPLSLSVRRIPKLFIEGNSRVNWIKLKVCQLRCDVDFLHLQPFISKIYNFLINDDYNFNFIDKTLSATKINFTTTDETWSILGVTNRW